MTKPLKKGVCAFCGKEYVLKERRWKPTCSPECGEARMKTATRNLKAKSGPFYERWKNHLVATIGATITVQKYQEWWNSLDSEDKVDWDEGVD